MLPADPGDDYYQGGCNRNASGAVNGRDFSETPIDVRNTFLCIFNKRNTLSLFLLMIACASQALLY